MSLKGDDLQPVLVAHLKSEDFFLIDRTRWNVIYGSARYLEHLGMHMVYDLISFQSKIVAKK